MILLKLLLLVFIVHLTYQSDDERDAKLLERTMNTLHRLLEYLHKHRNQINLDTVLGVRIAQGKTRS